MIQMGSVIRIHMQSLMSNETVKYQNLVTENCWLLGRYEHGRGTVDDYLRSSTTSHRTVRGLTLMLPKVKTL